MEVVPTEAPTGPLLTVSIVSHGDGSRLPQLLSSMARCEETGNIQLLVTDNLGHDLAEIPPRDWHSATVLRPACPRGFARNHNEAFQAAAGEFFCVLNPDVVFQEGVLLQLVQRIRRGEARIVAPLLVDLQGRVQDSYRKLPSPWELVRRRVGRAAFTASPPEEAVIRPDWIAGTFMLMRSATFADLGGFDAGYRLYFEDVDLCTRAQLRGMMILVDATLRVQHDPRRASRRVGAHLLWHIQSAMRFFGSPAYRLARGRRLHSEK